MQVNIPYRDLVGTGVSDSGGTLTTPLILAVDPATEPEAATKQYVDSKIAYITTDNIKSGTLDVARFPALAGEINCETGSGYIELTDTGVVAGTYPKVTVDSRGRVTAGSQLVSDDIPLLKWSKFTAGKPTTLDGYGITNALNKNGGTVTGPLTISIAPSETLHAANKVYVDNKVALITGLLTGDTIRTSIATTPLGFLRCNGGQVSKTMYSSLYNVIGDRFTFFTTPGSGKPWKHCYDINNPQTDDITVWLAGSDLPLSLAYSQVLVTKNRIYLIGGYSNNNYINSVYTANINMDGSIGPWTTSSPLPGSLGESQLIVTKNRVYLLGGHNGLTGYSNVTYTATINEDGTLGTWTIGSILPIALVYSQAVITKDRVYLLGGYNGSSLSNVYTAAVNADGTLGSWLIGPSLPSPLSLSQVVITKNRLYLLGGFNNANYTNVVYTAPINNDGSLGNWSSAPPLPVNVGGGQTLTTKAKVYLFGGTDGSVYNKTVYMAPINSDGTLGNWTTGSDLPENIANSQIAVTKNKVFLLGGYNSLTMKNVYFANITGGLNDYSPYYDGTLVPTDPDKFRLPDYTSKEGPNVYYYIIY